MLDVISKLGRDRYEVLIHMETIIYKVNSTWVKRHRIPFRRGRCRMEMRHALLYACLVNEDLDKVEYMPLFHTTTHGAGRVNFSYSSDLAKAFGDTNYFTFQTFSEALQSNKYFAFNFAVLCFFMKGDPQKLLERPSCEKDYEVVDLIVDELEDFFRDQQPHDSLLSIHLMKTKKKYEIRRSFFSFDDKSEEFEFPLRKFSLREKISEHKLKILRSFR